MPEGQLADNLARAAGAAPLDARDWAVIGGYMLVIMLVGCLAWWLRRRGSAGSEYFLAGRSLTWPVIGMALFSTNISSIHLVSLAQAGYDSGLARGNFEWMAAFTLLILALFFAPFYIRSGVTTLPDFLEKRYSRGLRDWLAVVSILSAIFIHLGFTLYTGAQVLKGFVSFPQSWLRVFDTETWCIVLTAVLTGVYTVVGGLLAVVLTESLQTIVLIAGAALLTWYGYAQVGGWDSLQTTLASKSEYAAHLTLLRPASDPSGLPWYSIILGYPVIGIWYWCTDQTIVQRVLGAKDEHHARIGPLFAGFIKILPVFIFVLPGTLCLALILQNQMPGLPLDERGQPDTLQTYMHIIKEWLPVGVRGIVIAALLAALMSTVSGATELDRHALQLRPGEALAAGRLRPPAGADRPRSDAGGHDCRDPLVADARSLSERLRRDQPDDHLRGPAHHYAFCVGGILAAGFARRGLGRSLGRHRTGRRVRGLRMERRLRLAQGDLGHRRPLHDGRGIPVPCLLGDPRRRLAAAAGKALAGSEALVWKSPLEALRGPWRGLGDFRLVAAVLFAVMIGLYWWFD